MKKFQHDVCVRFAKLLNILLVTVPFAVCWYGYYAKGLDEPFYRKGNWAVVGVFVLLYVIFARVYDAFLISRHRISEMVYSQSLALLISDGILYVIIWLLSRSFPNLLPGLATLAVQFMISVVWSLLSHRWYFATFPPKPTAIISGGQYAMDQMIDQYGLEKKFDIRVNLPAEECLQDLSVLEGIETVFIGGVPSLQRNVILKHCIDNGIDLYVLPRIGDILMSGAKKEHMFHLPMLRVGRCHPHPEALLIKRLFDIVSSAAALLLVSPIMLITALAIKTDGGPVFYKQTRLTKDGKEFKVLKFRSMRTDAEKDGVARLSTGDKDDRITPVGHIIRKLRIDELPQLLNILGGSMSVVGPRPERPEIARQYEEELPEFRLRLQVKAGLTGYAQVYGKYNTTPYDKLQMDLMYIANPSFVEDLKIIFATIKILFLPESTDGIAEGQTTAAASSAKEPVGAGSKK